MGILSKLAKSFPEVKTSVPQTVSAVAPLPRDLAPPGDSQATVLAAAPELTTPEPSPCPACHSPGFWLSVYGGGLRCLSCETPPGRSLVRRKLFLAAEPVDPLHPGGPWRRVIEPWEWHFGSDSESVESVTAIVDATGLDDERPVSRITWQWKGGVFAGAKVESFSSP